jgi:hypothetical protein
MRSVRRQPSSHQHSVLPHINAIEAKAIFVDINPSISKFFFGIDGVGRE